MVLAEVEGRLSMSSVSEEGDEALLMRFEAVIFW